MKPKPNVSNLFCVPQKGGVYNRFVRHTCKVSSAACGRTDTQTRVSTRRREEPPREGNEKNTSWQKPSRKEEFAATRGSCRDFRNNDFENGNHTDVSRGWANTEPSISGPVLVLYYFRMPGPMAAHRPSKLCFLKPELSLYKSSYLQVVHGYLHLDLSKTRTAVFLHMISSTLIFQDFAVSQGTQGMLLRSIATPVFPSM